MLEQFASGGTDPKELKVRVSKKFKGSRLEKKKTTMETFPLPPICILSDQAVFFNAQHSQNRP